MGESKDREVELEEALAEYLRESESGRTPDTGEWLRRHPDLQEELKDFLAHHHEITNLTRAGPAGTSPALRRIGDYELEAELGRGGMGVVYRARQVSLDRLVAVKMILGGWFAHPEDLLRFNREAQAAANLDHPNIVPIYEVSQHEGLPYYSMKLVEGTSLASLLEGFAARPRDTARMIADVARAVHHAHQRGILHRDLKPGNILLDGSGRPHVTDFGLARREGEGGLTSSGSAVGTPAYMAPELSRPQPMVSVAADVYSLGVILYEILAGRPPFSGASSWEIVEAARDLEPPKISPARRADRDLETISLKCLQKVPSRRYGSALALAEDLERWLDGRPILARRTGTLERVRKWARRRPLVASLVFLVALLLVSGAGGVAWEWSRAARTAEELRIRSYLKTIALAEHEISTRDAAHGNELLNECPPDLRGWEWGCLKRLSHRSPLTLRGHAGPLTGVVFCPNGTLAASAGVDGAVKVWNVRTGVEEASLKRDDQPVRGIAVCPQGIVCGHFDGKLQVWDWRQAGSARTIDAHKLPVWCVAASPDGRTAASAAGGILIRSENEIRLWDLPEWRLKAVLDRRPSRIAALAFSPDGMLLASGGADRVVRIWDAGDGSLRQELAGHTEQIFGLAFSPDGTLLASASGDIETRDRGEVRLWEVSSGTLLRTMQGRTNEVWCIAFSHDGTRLASGTSVGPIRLWDPKRGDPVLVLEGHRDRVRSLVFSPDGSLLVSASEDRTLKVWSAEPLGPSEIPPARIRHEDRIRSISIRRDGLRGASGGQDRVVKVWDIPSRSVLFTLEGHEGAVRSVDFSPDGLRVASVGSDDSIRIWDAELGRPVRVITKEVGYATAVAFRPPDGREIASISGYRPTIWDAGTGEPLRSFEGHSWVVTGLAFSPDGKLLASSGMDQTVRVWDADTGRAIQILRGHTGRVRGVAFSPDGRTIVSASSDESARIWDVATGREEARLTGHRGDVNSAAFSPEGRLVATAGEDGTARVWRVSDGKELHQYRSRDPGRLRGVAFVPPQGRTLALARGDPGHGEVILWVLPESAFRGK